jgi:glycosyltransferase involved in cell wall biosynthesis
MKSDAKFKQTIVAWHHIRVALRRWIRALKDETAWSALPRRESQPPATSGPKVFSALDNKPLIFVSYAAGDDLRGSHKFCGGEKLLNNLVLLLRRHGYEAWMVSTDGNHANWLAEHAPFLSIDDFRRKLAESPAVRCVTSWIPAKAFLDFCPHYYFWDQELGASARSHFPQLAQQMARGRIVRTAGVNRAVQAWHRATFGQPALLLRQLVDECHWQPDEQKRVPMRVGYFDEGEHGEKFIAGIRERTCAAGFELEFHLLRGVEKEIIGQMQACGTFLALNVGKSPLWGEGGPMTTQEAMACGTVPVCFDINGPWEFIQQNYNGVVLADFTPEALAYALISIYSEPGRLAKMSRRCIEITASAHTMEARWPDVCRFLDLST